MISDDEDEQDEDEEDDGVYDDFQDADSDMDDDPKPLSFANPGFSRNQPSSGELDLPILHFNPITLLHLNLNSELLLQRPLQLIQHQSNNHLLKFNIRILLLLRSMTKKKRRRLFSARTVLLETRLDLKIVKSVDYQCEGSRRRRQEV